MCFGGICAAACVSNFLHVRNVPVLPQFLEPDEIETYIKRIEKQREEGDKKKGKKATPSGAGPS